MYKRNIISAGKMMAIVMMLFGVLYCAAAFVPSIFENFDKCPEWLLRTLPYSVAGLGALFFVSGAALAAMFSRADGRPSLSTGILAVGTLITVCALLSLAFIYHTPVSWMTGILGLAIFVDSLCLKILFSKR